MFKGALQKLLSLYHPDLNKLYFEVDNEKQAESELDMFEVEYDKFLKK